MEPFDSHRHEHDRSRRMILAQHVEQTGHHTEPEEYKDGVEHQELEYVEDHRDCLPQCRALGLVVLLKFQGEDVLLRNEPVEVEHEDSVDDHAPYNERQGAEDVICFHQVNGYLRHHHRMTPV